MDQATPTANLLGAGVYDARGSEVGVISELQIDPAAATGHGTHALGSHVPGEAQAGLRVDGSGRATVAREPGVTGPGRPACPNPSRIP